MNVYANASDSILGTVPLDHVYGLDTLSLLTVYVDEGFIEDNLHSQG
jgi:hypothetical protein